MNGKTTIYDVDENLLARYDLSLQSAGARITTRKPLVAVQCTGFPKNASSLTLYHDVMVWPPWQSEPLSSVEWTFPASDFSKLSVDSNSSILNSSWINIDQFEGVKPSLGAFFAAPEAINPSGCYACDDEIKSGSM